MERNIAVYLLVMAAVSYAIRSLPLLFIKREIKNKVFRSFLYYVPYVTLAVMTVPDMVNATGSPVTGLVALAVGVILAWKNQGLLKVAVGCCAAALLLGLLGL